LYVLQHFRETGECPFGSSCFYLHIRPDGSIEDREPPKLRVVLTADATAEVKKHATLADFVRLRI
jgi:hypothetical protein